MNINDIERLHKEYKKRMEAYSFPILEYHQTIALADFHHLGFPLSKDERYQYTEVGSLLTKFSEIRPCFPEEYPSSFISDTLVPKETNTVGKDSIAPGIQITMVNGFLQTVNNLLQYPIWIGSLKHFSESYPQLMKSHYAKLADNSQNGLVALNTLFSYDGVVIYVPQRCHLQDTIEIKHWLRADTGQMENHHILVIVEENAQVQLSLFTQTLGHTQVLSSQVVECYVGKNSSLELYEAENTDVGTIRFSNLFLHQEADSQVVLGTVTIHNGITHNYTETCLADKGAAVSLSGMALIDQKRHVDNYTFIDHRAGGCHSKELYKYILDDYATGSFAGKVLVREGAQQTYSQQTNRNLCLSKEARMYTRPQMEIYADDVKCGHGATVGQLDDSALFYMRQRGIPEKEARRLLLTAFLEEMTERIPLTGFKGQIRQLMEKRLHKEKTTF